MGEQHTCQNCKQSFLIEPEDFSFYKKINVPPPTFCPDCRMRRRFAWRNEHNIYRRKDDHDGKEIFAGFAPSAPVKVYEKDYWISDAWDAITYGRDYDLSRPFFEQFKELMHVVPWPSRSVIRLVNSDYCDQAGDLKNCYLCFNCDHAEDSIYVMRSAKIRTSIDLTQSLGDELCYGGVSLTGCYRAFFSENCESCSDIWFSENCTGCTNCFGSANLRGKSYHFLNEPLTKEEYEKRLAALDLGSWSGLQAAGKLARENIAKYPVKNYHGYRAVDSTGEYLTNTKNVKETWFADDAQDVKYSQNVYMGVKDCYDLTVWGGHISLMYESVTCGEESNRIRFSFECWPSCRDLEYCVACHSSSDLFGCVGLNKKQYCIFNRQYSKEEYFALRDKIIAQMKEMPYRSARGHEYRYGEFFPEEFSPFGYNETMLHDTFPLPKEEALAKGYTWYDAEAREYETSRTAADLPDSIRDVTDEILKDLIQCGNCKRAYRVVLGELGFLRQMGIPLPRECPNCRLAERLKQINKPVYCQRTCACVKLGHFHGESACQGEFRTAYAPERPETVYCERCYNAEVV